MSNVDHIIECIVNEDDDSIPEGSFNYILVVHSDEGGDHPLLVADDLKTIMEGALKYTSKMLNVTELRWDEGELGQYAASVCDGLVLWIYPVIRIS